MSRQNEITVTVDSIEDYSEKSWKLTLGEAHYFMPKSCSTRDPDYPDMITAPIWRIRQLEEAAQRTSEAA